MSGTRPYPEGFFDPENVSADLYRVRESDHVPGTVLDGRFTVLTVEEGLVELIKGEIRKLDGASSRTHAYQQGVGRLSSGLLDALAMVQAGSKLRQRRRGTQARNEHLLDDER